MKIFTVNSDNSISSYASAAQDWKIEGQTFTTFEELLLLAKNWPSGRLVEIWNRLNGVTPVKKFTDRKTAIARIWKAIQVLEPSSETTPTNATRSRDVGAGSAGKAKTKAQAKEMRKPARAGEGTQNGSAREGSKTAVILELIQRKQGATLQELMAAASWQAHSVRGFLSAIVGKKLGLTLESTKRDDGQRVYQIGS